MLTYKDPKLFPIADFEVLLRYLSRLWLDIARFGFALAPQVNRIATDIEQLTRLTFLESVQLDRLHYFLPEVIAVRFCHWKGEDAIGILLAYVLTCMAVAINLNKNNI